MESVFCDLQKSTTVFMSLLMMYFVWLPMVPILSHQQFGLSCESASYAFNQPSGITPPSTEMPVIFLHPKPEMSSIEVELNYSNLSYPNGFELTLMYDVRKTSRNCCNPSGMPKIHNCSTFFKEAQKFYCEKLEPGPYCARINCKGCKNPWNVYYTDMVQLDKSHSLKVPITSSESRQVEDGIGGSKLISIALGVCFTIMALTILGLIVYCRRNYQDKDDDDEVEIPSATQLQLQLLYEAVMNKLPVNVFLLYYPDCCHHIQFVETLAKVLSLYNCKVSYDLKEKNSIVINAVTWIQSKLSSKNKILIINSREAYEQQKMWLKTKKVVIKDVSNEGSIFFSALALLMHRPQQAFNYNNIYMLRPSYVSDKFMLQDVCPCRRYEIFKDLRYLICNLHDLNPRTIDFARFPDLPPEEMDSSFETLSKLVCDISGMDMLVDGSYFDSMCHLCHASTQSAESGLNDRLLV